MSKHRFGGEWTQQKLDRVEAYLAAYVQVMKNQSFRTVYIDAFAGTGYVDAADSSDSEAASDEMLRFFDDAPEVPEVMKGSAIRALELEPSFDQYIFIEKNRRRFSLLNNKLQPYSIHRDIICRNGDANAEIESFCQSMGSRDRGVIFLDPYGMSVNWAALEAIAQTEKLDMWLLFPSGIGVNRMTPRDKDPEASWIRRLSAVLGDDRWLESFYATRVDPDLFEEQERKEKVFDVDKIDAYFVEKLKKIFGWVAPNPLPLKTDKNVHLFSLHFAVSNPSNKAQKRASDIANHVLNPSWRPKR